MIIAWDLEDMNILMLHRTINCRDQTHSHTHRNARVVDNAERFDII